MSRRSLSLLCGLLMLPLVSASSVRAQDVDASRCIAVPPFVNLRPRSTTQWIGPAAAQILIAKLNTVPGFLAFQPPEVQQLVAKQREIEEAADPHELAIAVAKELGAARVVLAEYVEREKQQRRMWWSRKADKDTPLEFEFDLRVVDVQTGESLGEEGLTARTDQIADLLNRLAETVVATYKTVALTDQQQTRLRLAGLTNVSTLEAFGAGLAYHGPAQRIHAFNKALGFDPHYPWIHYNSGVAHVRKADYDRARRKFSVAIALKADFAAAYHERGKIHAREGNYDLAMSDFTRAIKLKDNFAAAYYHRGSAAEQTGRLGPAILNYSLAVTLRPNDPAPYFRRGMVYDLRGEHDHAVRDYTKTIEFDDQNAKAYYNRGVDYFISADYDKAVQDFTKAIELDSDLVDAYHSRGLAHLVRGSQDGAIRDFTKAIELKADDPRAYYNRGLAYDDKGNRSRAIQDYTRAIELKPDFAAAYFLRATAYYRNRAYNDAWDDINMCRQLGSEPDLEFLQRLTKDSGRSG